MKRIVCSLCGGTGVAYEVPDPVETRENTPKIPAIEKQYQFDFPPTPEEDEAWKEFEKRNGLSS